MKWLYYNSQAGEFCQYKVLRPTGVLLNSVIYTVSVPSSYGTTIHKL